MLKVTVWKYPHQWGFLEKVSNGAWEGADDKQDIDAFGSKSIQDFGDLFRLYDIFVKSTGLELSIDLSRKFEKEPKDWRAYYIAKTESINEADNDILLDQGNKEYNDARKSLTTLQDDMNYSVLVHVASKMLWILGNFFFSI